QPLVVVAKSFEKRTMELVVALPGDQLDRRRKRKLRARASGLDAEFLNGIESGLYARDAATVPVDIRNPVEQHLRRADFHAVHSRIPAAFHARRQIEQVGDLAPVEWQVVNAESIFCV